MQTISDDLLEQILRSPEPLWELRGAMRLLVAQGRERSELVARLEAFKGRMRSAGRSDRDLGVIDDTIAHLIGYCSPHLRL